MALGWKKDYLRYKDFFLDILAVYNNKPNLKIYLEMILSLSTIVLFSVFAIRPTIITIAELNKEIATKEETSKLLKQKINNLLTANSILENEANNLNYLSEAIPLSANPETIVSQVEFFAGSYSLQLIGFSMSDVVLIGKQNTTDQNELPFTISISGPYQDLYSFLRALENLKRPVKIDSLTINSTFTENGKTIVMIINGRIPYL